MNIQTTTESIWQRSKLLIKGLMIGVLALLLLIPTFFITSIIEEREARQREAVQEVSSKWAGRQSLAGPVLVLPFMQTIATDSTGKAKVVKQTAYFLPDELKVAAQVQPQERSRGIFKVMLYTAQSNISGRFNSLPFDKLNIDPATVLWNEASVQFSLSDPKGLNEELILNWNGSPLSFTAQGFDESGGARMVAPLKLSGPAGLQSVKFSGRLHLNGSESLYLTPVGKSTNFELKSPWPHPSFTGAILPQASQVSTTGFSATWKSLSHKRSFPQQWRNSNYATDVAHINAGITNVTPDVAPAQQTNATFQLGRDAFGVDLFIPVNGYQKTLRSIKYAILCIVLTFCAFFLVETANKRSVHPFHYALVGIALLVFYLLLLSFSEYIGFNAAYAVATVATVSLIGWFVKGLLASGRLSLLLSLVLVLLYGYVFTILQLQDYSLLLGSIGLFATLAVVMYFSKRFQW